MNKEAIKFGTLSELEIMEKEAQETLEAIRNEIESRHKNSRLENTIAKVRDFVKSNSDKFLFIKTERSETGPQYDIIRLSSCEVKESHYYNNVDLLPKYRGFYSYHSKNVSRCSAHFCNSDYCVTTLSIDEWNTIINDPSEVLKTKEYVKTFIHNTLLDSLKTDALEIIDNAKSSFDIDIKMPTIER